MVTQVNKTEVLHLYEYLQGRKKLSADEKQQHYNETQGYIGEKKLEEKLKQYSVHAVQLYGLLLEHKASYFQIDGLLIFADKIVLIEVKNIKGEFEFRDDKLYSIDHRKFYHHPFHQLQRTEMKLQALLMQLNISIPIKSYVVFINPACTLFTHKNPQIVLPTQIDTWLQALSEFSGMLETKHEQVADKLVSQCLTQSPFSRFPKYSYNELQKGVLCLHCRQTMERKKRKVKCCHCTYQENLSSHILRGTIEFAALFPEQKMTTQAIINWSNGIVSERTIRNILRTYLAHHVNSTASYFTHKDRR